jgi:hypothetical protein
VNETPGETGRASARAVPPKGDPNASANGPPSRIEGLARRTWEGT